jgi:hypothetical protein
VCIQCCRCSPSQHIFDMVTLSTPLQLLCGAISDSSQLLCHSFLVCGHCKLQQLGTHSHVHITRVTGRSVCDTGGSAVVCVITGTAWFMSHRRQTLPCVQRLHHYTTASFHVVHCGRSGCAVPSWRRVFDQCAIHVAAATLAAVQVHDIVCIQWRKLARLSWCVEDVRASVCFVGAVAP